MKPCFCTCAIQLNLAFFTIIVSSATAGDLGQACEATGAMEILIDLVEANEKETDNWTDSTATMGTFGQLNMVSLAHFSTILQKCSCLTQAMSQIVP